MRSPGKHQPTVSFHWIAHPWSESETRPGSGGRGGTAPALGWSPPRTLQNGLPNVLAYAGNAAAEHGTLVDERQGSVRPEQVSHVPDEAACPDLPQGLRHWLISRSSALSDDWWLPFETDA
jgi:hypothetical protein